MLNKINIKLKAILVFIIFSIFVLNTNTLRAQSKNYIIVLDAGHGGHDPGKVVNGENYYEKDIALKITLEVGKILENQKNVKVIYTRKKDVFVNLYERGRIANRADADLFVSIHCNAHNSQASGTETWALGLHANKQNLEVAKKENEVILLEENYEENYKGFDPNSPESIIGMTLLQEEYMDQSLALANIVQSSMVKGVKFKNRGVKQAAFIVLHQTYMPSILIETGFITNKKEGAYLNSSKGQTKYAASVSKGILEYIKQENYNSVDEKIISRPSSSNSTIVEGVTFKVQIASGTKKLETKAYNFKGLKNIERVKIGESYKYYLGKTSDFDKIKSQHLLAKQKGYKSAFVVAFRGKKKISVKEALKSSK
ncbi:MAG: N-acetylmuramoyl-L-alanine amidase [Flavobacteriaceae bacterium]|nr:N-acetylmuramoyl-L-alanine amidase [Flavobacteriaceae bacterium]